ncbi:MAG: glutamate--tRNA ligase [Rhodobacterales bacterium]|nr:glutamate--tRNA ligase [Rhodobacterales bacterium]
MSVVTRFAPSPTGFLHIGGARTALFNWLFAKHHDGRFLLRIEDTDRARSTQAAVDAIFDGLSWLGLDWDGEAVSQFARADLHRAAAERLLAEGRAYKCYCSPEELAEMREKARAEGRSALYDGRWRDRDPADAPPGVAPVIRLKTPNDGETVVDDAVQGTVRVANTTLDDMVLLRADGTPTYMLAVVVDDHDMGVTHVIRGDDHLTNTFRQVGLYNALGWDTPVFAHIPLIHGPDGAKMSKRHGALGAEAYRDMGFLPEALCNYLLRLGWSHGDDEIITIEQAIQWFDLAAVNKGAARFDMDKLTSLNGHYIRHADDGRLADLVLARMDAPGPVVAERVRRAIPHLKERAKTIVELTESAQFLSNGRPLALAPKAAQLLDDDGRAVLRGLRDPLTGVTDWTVPSLEAAVRSFADGAGLKLGKVAQPLRAALTGTTVSPGIFDVLDVLGSEEALGRIDDALAQRNPRD